MDILKILAERQEASSKSFIEVSRKELIAFNECIGGGKMRGNETLFFRGLPLKVVDNVQSGSSEN